MVYVDADSCPVKEDIVEISFKYGYESLFVASYAHMSNSLDELNWKYVDTGKEAADLFIMNAVKKRDIVVTQDIGLASTLLLKEVIVLSPRGMIYDESSIKTALDLRYLSAKARRNGIYGKGPKPFTEQDRKKFRESFLRILSKNEGEKMVDVE
ncbi:MAG TPA: YaiI/YqxD family protein [Niallia sp.]|nr:YaiI/YqxD family protein [Niallia sp.]